jgi:hypothetical protein
VKSGSTLCWSGVVGSHSAQMDDLDLDTFGTGPSQPSVLPRALASQLVDGPSSYLAEPRRQKRPRSPTLPTSGGSSAQTSRPSKRVVRADAREGRVIPGPAGRSGSTDRARSSNNQSPSTRAATDKASSFVPPPPPGSDALAMEKYFSECQPWVAAGQACDLPLENSSTGKWPLGVFRPPITIADLLAAPVRSRPGVLLVIALVVSIAPSEWDALLTLRDPTGVIIASATRRVLEEAGTSLVPGSVVVLQNCSVFSPTAEARYLNIVPSNVLAVYDPWSPVQMERDPVDLAQLTQSGR